MATPSFFKSVTEDTFKQLEAGGPAALMPSTTDMIVNDGLFGRKRTRLYFTKLKSLETRQSTKTMEMESEAYNLPDVELWIDPKTIGVKKKVNQKRTLTKAGYVVQFWGHELTTVSMSGISGYYGVTKGLAPRIIGGIIDKGKPQVDALKAFEYLKENAYMKRFDKRIPFKGLPTIGMVYDQVMYRGFFETFDYSLDANMPFTINYSFSFTIIPPESDIQQLKDSIENAIPTSLADVSDTARGMASGTIMNPNGTSQKVSDAMAGLITKSTQAGIDELSKKLGVQSFLDVTPSRVLLY